MTQGLAQEASPPTTVADVMRPPLTTVEQDGHAAAAAFLMKRAHATALVVLADELSRRPVGLITEADIVTAVADGKDPSETRIHDLMTLKPTVIAGSTSVREAAEAMLAGNFRHLPVVEDSALVGIVDLADVCRSLLDAPVKPV
ncbi:MAG: CBS domain-containing protein [Frankia sp.]